MKTNQPLPTFIIGGAPRSGTTYLCHALDRHPEVYIAKPFIPEPKVFMGPQKSTAEYRDCYRRLFAGAGNRKALGEKTSYYLESSAACERIAEIVPDVKMLFILREPVARAYSNYLWSKKNGLETLPFEEAIEKEGQRPSPLPPDKAHARPFDYTSRGNYAELARPYLERFGKERVAFCLFEAIQADPQRLFESIQRFIGVTPLPFARLDVGVVNSAREMGPELDPSTHRRLKKRFVPVVHEFAKVSGLDLGVWGY